MQVLLLLLSLLLISIHADFNVSVDDADADKRYRYIINTIAGTGTAGSSGDGSNATSAFFSSPTGIAVDASGDIYIADRNNHKIRKVRSVPTSRLTNLHQYTCYRIINTCIIIVSTHIHMTP